MGFARSPPRGPRNTPGLRRWQFTENSRRPLANPRVGKPKRETEILALCKAGQGLSILHWGFGCFDRNNFSGKVGMVLVALRWAPSQAHGVVKGSKKTNKQTSSNLTFKIIILSKSKVFFNSLKLHARRD